MTTDGERPPDAAAPATQALSPTGSGVPAAPYRASYGPVADLIGRVAETDVTVLLRGERGTGKQRVARAIHAASRRRDRSFVKIDCAAPVQVLETELFGCDRGSAAGAGQDRPGRLEFAHGVTLFLEHVSEVPVALQAQLQRALEDGGFPRPGARDEVHADVRVIASSERDLERAVDEGRFREGLFFRLNVVCLTLPPLRQRRTDLAELAAIFVRRYAAHFNKPERALSDETLRLFVNHSWPGNLHELEAIVKRIVMIGNQASVREDLVRRFDDQDAVISSEEECAQPSDAFGLDVAAGASSAPPMLLKEIARQAADGAERELIARALQQTRWNRREAAQMLGVSYKALLYKIKRAELDGGP
jgi:two-component system response regulator AtoC